jgi:hypothetical protein
LTSTSPALPSAPFDPTASLRSKSPAPSTYSYRTQPRSRSPASSIYVPFPSSPHYAASLHSGRSVDVGHTTPATPVAVSKNRASWTAGLWGWSGAKKQRPRKGSIGSIASQKVQTTSIQHALEEAAMTQEEDEQSWRKGDGGSPPSFRAIFLATVSHHDVD